MIAYASKKDWEDDQIAREILHKEGRVFMLNLFRRELRHELERIEKLHIKNPKTSIKYLIRKCGGLSYDWGK